MEMCSILHIGALSQDLKPDVRRFFAFDRDGKLVGYTSQHNCLPEADATLHFAIKRVAIETFQKEGPKVSISGFRRSPTPGMMRSSNQTGIGSVVCLDWAFKSRLFNRFHICETGGSRSIVAYQQLNRLPSLRVPSMHPHRATCEPPSEAQPPQFIVCLFL